MILLIQAELRKCWKTKKMMIATICFLCFMGCAYILSLQRDQRAHFMETIHLSYEGGVARTTYGSLKSDIQNTPIEKETPALRAQFNVWKEAAEASEDYAAIRQAPEYFGYEDIAKASLRYNKAIQDVWTSKYYDGELDHGERTLKDTQVDMEYFTYLKEHELTMYSSIYEPTLSNFFMQIFQNETMVLLIVISSFFLIDQLCHDFDCGTYKNIYITPHKRRRILVAKVMSSLCMNVIAFLLAFLLFAIVPISQHGVGTILYPYILHQQIITFIPLFLQTMGLMVLVLLVYMTICVIAANLFKNTTNTLLLIAGILLIVYFCFKFFGTDIPLLYWIPLFYFYPYDIIAGAYAYPLVVCMLLCVVFIVGIYTIFYKHIENNDLKGSEAL